jgi:hypothetical protein
MILNLFSLSLQTMMDCGRPPKHYCCIVGSGMVGRDIKVQDTIQEFHIIHKKAKK